MLGMPDRVYQTVDGLQVTLEAWNWTNHIQRRHPAITESDIAQALTAPVWICHHRIEPTQRVYQGSPRSLGFFRGSFPVVVVELIDERTGRVVTAYLTTLPYPGRQRWP
jgi:hypothetical protein